MAFSRSRCGDPLYGPFPRRNWLRYVAVAGDRYGMDVQLATAIARRESGGFRGSMHGDRAPARERHLKLFGPSGKLHRYAAVNPWASCVGRWASYGPWQFFALTGVTLSDAQTREADPSILQHPAVSTYFFLRRQYEMSRAGTMTRLNAMAEGWALGRNNPVSPSTPTRPGRTIADSRALAIRTWVDEHRSEAGLLDRVLPPRVIPSIASISSDFGIGADGSIAGSEGYVPYVELPVPRVVPGSLDDIIEAGRPDTGYSAIEFNTYYVVGELIYALVPEMSTLFTFSKSGVVYTDLNPVDPYETMMMVEELSADADEIRPSNSLLRVLLGIMLSKLPDRYNQFERSL